MATSILIIAHAPLASALKDCAAHVYGYDPHSLDCLIAVDVSADADPAAVADSISAKLASNLPERNSTLILTDVIGASPANIAEKLLRHADTVLITGVNLPMVLTAVCHRHKAFDQLCALVKEAGAFGITLRKSV
ncbi:MAG TPA: PTS fructose transporter subunit IIA [Sutterella sp.]|nr:PTS fructose transporter subunit IIA [Sutterella sp.]